MMSAAGCEHPHGVWGSNSVESCWLRLIFDSATVYPPEHIATMRLKLILKPAIAWNWWSSPAYLSSEVVQVALSAIPFDSQRIKCAQYPAGRVTPAKKGDAP